MSDSTGLKIKQKIDENNRKIEEITNTSMFVLNEEVAKLLQNNEDLRKICPHTYNGKGICIYCYSSKI